jgi:hypothetical protein
MSQIQTSSASCRPVNDIVTNYYQYSVSDNEWYRYNYKGHRDSSYLGRATGVNTTCYRYSPTSAIWH